MTCHQDRARLQLQIMEVGSTPISMPSRQVLSILSSPSLNRLVYSDDHQHIQWSLQRKEQHLFNPLILWMPNISLHLWSFSGFEKEQLFFLWKTQYFNGFLCTGYILPSVCSLLQSPPTPVQPWAWKSPGLFYYFNDSISTSYTQVE